MHGYGIAKNKIADGWVDRLYDYYLNKGDFNIAIKKALDANLEREIGEFCDKTGLTQHVYQDFNGKIPLIFPPRSTQSLFRRDRTD